MRLRIARILIEVLTSLPVPPNAQSGKYSALFETHKPGLILNRESWTRQQQHELAW